MALNNALSTDCFWPADSLTINTKKIVILIIVDWLVLQEIQGSQEMAFTKGIK